MIIQFNLNEISRSLLHISSRAFSSLNFRGGKSLYLPLASFPASPLPRSLQKEASPHPSGGRIPHCRDGAHNRFSPPPMSRCESPAGRGDCPAPDKRPVDPRPEGKRPGPQCPQCASYRPHRCRKDKCPAQKAWARSWKSAPRKTSTAIPCTLTRKPSFRPFPSPIPMSNASACKSNWKATCQAPLT